MTRQHSHWSFLVLLGIAGCGGGGTAVAGEPAPQASGSLVGSAKFIVNAHTGEVKVEGLSGDSRAAFGGNSISFTSSTLLSEGSPERRILRVTAKNNTAEVIGSGGQYRLVFSNFRNDNVAITDLRGTVLTSTLVGNGTNTTTFGPLSSSTIGSPKALVYDEANGTLLAAGSQLTGIDAALTKRLCSEAVNCLAKGPGVLIGGRSTDIGRVLDTGEFSPFTGAEAGHVDGSFAAARFTQIRDLWMVSASGPDDFVALIADGRRVRRVEVSAAYPAGNVTTLRSEAFEVSSVTEKDGILYYTLGNRICIRKGPVFLTIGTEAPGSTDGYIDAAFNTPGHLRWLNDSLYLADSGNHKVRQISLLEGGDPMTRQHWWVSTLSGTGTPGSADGTLSMTHNSPVGLAAGKGEEIFVADLNGHRVRRILPISGRFATGVPSGTNPVELARLANPESYSPSEPNRDPIIVEEDPIPAGQSRQLGDWQFTLPEGLRAFSFVVTLESDITSPGVLPAAINTGTGTKGSPNVTVRGFAGAPMAGYVDGPVASAAFNSIGDLCMAQDGTIFVTDSNNHCLRRIDPAGNVTTIAGRPDQPGTVDGEARSSQLKSPNGIDCNPAGTTVYFTQMNHVVRTATLGVGMNPANRDSWTIRTIAGLAETSGSLDGSGADARLAGPSDLVYVSPTSLYLVEFGGNRIRTINRTGHGFDAGDHTVRIISGSLSGTPGMADSSIGIMAQFNGPLRGALTASGHLWVTDRENHCIRQVTSTGITTTVCGTAGSSGYKDANSAFTSKFYRPSGICIDPSGYSYVTDYSNHVVRRVSPTGYAATVAGFAGSLGQTDGSGATCLLTSPDAVCLSSSGDLYFSSMGRIRLVQRVIGS